MNVASNTLETKQEFGLFDASNPDELAFEPATVVPQKVGQRYGWVIEVRWFAPAGGVRVAQPWTRAMSLLRPCSST